MFLFLNNTDKKFKVQKGNLKEGKQNRRASVTFEKMRIDIYANDAHLAEIEKAAAKSDGSLNIVDVPNTRLYFNNLHNRPIVIGDSKTKGTDTLFLAQKVHPDERLVAVNHLDTALVVESKRVKDEYIAAIISFSVSRTSAVEFVTVLGDKYIYTKYTSNGKGNVKVDVATKPVSSVKNLNPEMRAGIKPFRPFRATHLVFVNERDLVEAKALLDSHNYNIIPFNNTTDLNNLITEQKGKGFTAATLFTANDKSEQLTSMEDSHLKLIVNNFKTAHLTYVDGYTKFKSLPPTPPKRPDFKGGKKFVKNPTKPVKQDRKVKK